MNPIVRFAVGVGLLVIVVAVSIWSIATGRSLSHLTMPVATATSLFVVLALTRGRRGCCGRDCDSC